MRSPENALVADAREVGNGSAGQHAVRVLAARLRGKAERRARSPDTSKILRAAAGLTGIHDVDELATLPESGVLERTSAGFRIAVRRKDPLGRRNFTIAHEIAHVYLLRDGECKRGHAHEKERRCDIFAAEFLMPPRQFRSWHHLLVAKGPVREALELANTFGVSIEACILRLQELKLYLDQPCSLLFTAQRRKSWKIIHAAYDYRSYLDLVDRSLEELGLEPDQSVLRTLDKKGGVVERVGVVVMPLPQTSRKGTLERIPAVIQYNKVAAGLGQLAVGFEPVFWATGRFAQQAKLTSAAKMRSTLAF